MDKVIDRISDIESAATSIMDHANEQKREFAREMEGRTALFDSNLEEKTRAQIEALRTQLNIEMNQQLERQQDNSRKILTALENYYKEHHSQYVEDLFQSIIKE